MENDPTCVYQGWQMTHRPINLLEPTNSETQGPYCCSTSLLHGCSHAIAVRITPTNAKRQYTWRAVPLVSIRWGGLHSQNPNQ